MYFIVFILTDPQHSPAYGTVPESPIYIIRSYNYNRHEYVQAADGQNSILTVRLTVPSGVLLASLTQSIELVPPITLDSNISSISSTGMTPAKCPYLSIGYFFLLYYFVQQAAERDAVGKLHCLSRQTRRRQICTSFLYITHISSASAAAARPVLRFVVLFFFYLSRPQSVVK